MPLVPIRRNLVTFRLLTGDNPQAVPDREVSTSIHVLEIEVTQELNRLSQATIKISDGSAAEQDFSISSSLLFAPGRSIDVKLGYQGTETSVFRGIITGNQHRYSGSQSTLILTCRPSAYLMTMSKKSRYFKDQSDSDIVRSLLAEYPIAVSTLPDFGTLHEQVMQINVSDWDFMISRMDIAGYACLTHPEGIKVFRPDVSSEEVLALQFGENLLSFDTATDLRTQSVSVNAAAWNFSGQEMLTVQSAPMNELSSGTQSALQLAELSASSFEISTPAALSEEQLQLIADAKQQRLSLGKVIGNISFQGTAAVAPGDWVRLSGLGSLFNGKVFVSAIAHYYRAGNWITEAVIGWNPDFFAETFNPHSEAATSGQFSRAQGLQIGVVTDIIDPIGEGRVRVRLPMIGTQDEGVFARLSTLDAGQERGTFFLPEIGDEVVIGFLNEDANQPMILGFLHSSSHPAPFDASADNPIKGFVSRSGLQMVFDDTEKRIELSTPDGRKVFLNDDTGELVLEDPQGNKVLLNRDGILLESAGNIEIKATGSITIEGGQIAAKAGSTLKMEGNASAELSSSGMTTVKGAIVQIN